MYSQTYIFHLIVLVLNLATSAFGKKIFCYYSSFSQTRHAIGKFLPEDINPHLCTHLIYAFVDITSDGRDLRPFNRNDQGPNGLYARTLALKEKNPNLKVLLAVGGWQIGSKPFIPMVSNEYNRKTWIKNVVNYLRTHGFDGFDVDWEFPATRGSPPEDKYRFTLLMKGLYEAFAQEAETTGKEKLLLTLATASGTYYIDQSYETDKIINYVDYMLLMTYNYHGQWEKTTGHHSGLNRHRNDPTDGEKAQLYQQWSIDYWLNVGIPKDKLIVGIPTYGMSYTLRNPSKNGLHAPANGGGRMGEYTREMGILAYYEICLNLQKKNWETVWIEEQAVPYAYGGDQWAGYENKKSVEIKAKNIVKRGLAGAFVWSVEMDDFDGICGQGEYPLLSTVVDVIGDESYSKPAAHKPTEVKETQAQLLQKIKYGLEQKARKYLSLSKVSKAAETRVKTHFQKLKRNQAWLKNRLASISTITTTTITTTTEPASSTGRIVTLSSADHVSKKPNNRKSKWWTNSIWGKTTTTTRKPWSRKSLLDKKKSKKVWVKKGFRHNIDVVLKNPNSKRAHELSSNEVHEVDSWQTTPWWSSASEGLRPLLMTKPRVAINARATGRPGFGHQRITTEKPPTTTTTIAPEPTTLPNAAAAAVDCHSLGVGTFAHPLSCEHFVICLPGNWRDYPPHVMSCPSGTRFDSNLKICNYARNVACYI